MTNINPLLDVMSEIDDSIITNTAKKSKKRPLFIAAAAAAALTVAIPITSGALSRESVVMMNEETVKPGYDVYTDEYGHKIETFAYDVPEYALTEDVEGRTAVGTVRAVYDPDIYISGGYKLVDEEGSEFLGGINGKYVKYRIDDGIQSLIGFDCANMTDDYMVLEFNHEHFHNENKVDKCLQVVKDNEIDDVLNKHGYRRHEGTVKTALVNGVKCEPYYDIYVNEKGTLIESYVLEFPEYALKEEREGLNSYGKLRVVYDPNDIDPNNWYHRDYRLVDEVGNDFGINEIGDVGGVNNRMVDYKTFEEGQTYVASGGIDAANFAFEDYAYYLNGYKHSCDGVEVDACILVYNSDKDEKYLEYCYAHGYYPNTGETTDVSYNEITEA